MKAQNAQKRELALEWSRSGVPNTQISEQLGVHRNTVRNWISNSQEPKSKQNKRCLVGIIMGSESDFSSMEEAAKVLKEFGISHEIDVVSAHRTPLKMVNYAQSAYSRGIRVIIAGAGGAAHLPGMTASLTTLPVIGVPIQSKTLSGLDSLYSIVQMPPGIPVATVGIGNSKNAALLAVQILAISDPNLTLKLSQYRESLDAAVKTMSKNVKNMSKK